MNDRTRVLHGTFLFLASAAFVACSARAPAKNPPAPGLEEHPVAVETIFGHVIEDRDRWLEKTSDPAVANWVTREQAATRNALDALPYAPAVRSRVRALLDAGDTIESVHRVSGRTFYLRRRAGEPVQRVCVRESTGEERTLYRVDISDGRATSVQYLIPSSDGRLVAFGVSKGGTEVGTLHLMDAATAVASELPDRLTLLGNPYISWLPGRSAFLYTRYPHMVDPDANVRYSGAEVRLHTVGSADSTDTLVLGAGSLVEPPLQLDDAPQVTAVPGSPYLVGQIYRGTAPDPAYYIGRLEDVEHTVKWWRLATSDDAIVEWGIRGSDLFAIGRKTSELGEVYHYDLDRRSAPEPYLANAGRKLIGVTASSDALYVFDADVEGAHLRAVRYGDRRAIPIRFPKDSSIIGWSSESSTPGVIVGVESWTESPHWLSVASDGAESDPFPDQSRFVLPKARVLHEHARSRDGTLVPITILMREDRVLDGTAPAFLQGYGSYEISVTPAFTAGGTVWLERGGILAYAHVRGGGELGRGWHSVATKEHKQLSVDDFVACAEYIVTSKLSSADRLGIGGTSAGGLLVSAAMTQRPDLFRAAYIQAGLVNPTRLLHMARGAENVDEFGSPAIPREFDALLALDAYQQIKTGAMYPAVLVSVGLNDPRVPVWQGAKLVAKLKRSASGSRPFLLRVEADGGHGSVDLNQQAGEVGDLYTFLLWQLRRGGS